MDNIIKPGSDATGDGVVQATNMLGLNTVANPQTLPYGATPDTLNTIYTVGGAVGSRPGTGIIGRVQSIVTSDGQELDTHQFRTTLGYNYLVVVREKDIIINDIVWDGSTNQIVAGGAGSFPDLPLDPRMTKLFVFASIPEQVSYVELGLGRLLLLTGTNTPVELRFNEYRHVVPSGGETDPEFDVSTFTGWHHAQGGRGGVTATNELAADCLVYVNGVLQDSGVTSEDLTTLTVTGTFSAGDTIDIVRIIWGWWSEARLWFGDQFFQTVRRFRADNSNRTVTIPERLRDGLTQYPNTTYGMPIIVGYGTVLDSPGRFGDFSYADNFGAQYYWISGTGQRAKDFAEAEAGTVVGSSPSSITFNQLHAAAQFDEETTSNSVTTTFARARDMQFTAGFRAVGQATGTQVLNSEVLVRKRFGDSVQDVSLTMDIEGADNRNAYQGIALEIPGFQPVIRRTNTTTRFNALCFHQWQDGTFSSIVDRRGIAPEAQILAINLVNEYIGAGAVKQRDQYNEDGFVIPAIGVSDFIDQGQGIFPACGSLFQNRLFLGGVASDPLRIFASAPTDAYLAGEQYLYFQADVYNDPDTAPIDFNLQNTNQSDFIARMEAAFGSLFCFGRDGVWRIRPSLNTQLCCGFGLSELRAEVFGDGRLFFAAEDGVFELRQSDGLSDTYVPEEISSSIRNIFDEFKVNQLDYDEVNNRLFAYDNNNTIYVYFSETGGWSRWQFALSQTLTLAATSLITTRTNDNHYVYWFKSDAFGTTRYYGVVQLDFPIVVDFLGQQPIIGFQWEDGNLLLGDLLEAPDHTTGSEDTLYLLSKTPRIPLLTSPQDTLYIEGGASTLGTEATFNVDSTTDGDWQYLSSCILKYNQSTNTNNYRLLPKFPEQVLGSFNEWEAVEVIPGITAQWSKVGPVDANTLTWSPVSTIGDEQLGWAYPTYWVSGKFNMGNLTQYKRVSGISLAFDNTFINPTKTEYQIQDNPTGQWVVGESTARHLVNAHVFTNFQDSFTQLPYEDVYNGADEFVGNDDHIFSNQTLVKVPVQGVGYDFQFGVFNYAPQAWMMTAFQLDGMLRGKKYNGV